MSGTMKDLAKYTGYSLGTISNYISGKVPVSEQKGNRIEQAIKELGYTVNMAARVLKTNSFQCIGVLIPSFSNQFLLQVSKYIERILRTYGYDMLVTSYNDDTENFYKQLRNLSQKTDGILCVPRPDVDYRIIAEEQKKVPIVMFDETTNEMVCDRVLVDNEKIVENVIDMLIHQGRTKIGFIAGKKRAYTTLQRKRGYENAFKRNGIPINETLMTYGTYEKKSGYLGFQKIRISNPDITDVFVVGYRMTLGVLAAVKAAGLEHEISIIGYDAYDISDTVDIKLGYIYQPYQEIAQMAVKLMMRRVNGDDKDFPTTVIINAELRMGS